MLGHRRDRVGSQFLHHCCCPARRPSRQPTCDLHAATPPAAPSGFPTTSAYGEQVFKFTELQGQGIEGADLSCAPSIVPGKCALSNVDEAMMVCHAMGGLCKAVTIYFHGAFRRGWVLA